VVLGLDYQIPLTGRLSWISKHSYQTVPFCTKLLQALLNAPNVPCCTMCMTPYQPSIFWSYPVQNTFHANQYLDLQS